MRGYETIILVAELLAAPPATVDTRLKERADANEDKWRTDPLDEAAEDALRRRQDPLIELSLARYARFVGAVKPLFAFGEPDGALRLAILSNRNLGKPLLSRFPASLFDDEEDLRYWLLNASSLEFAALFHNPSIDERFIRELLEGKKEWAKIPDERLMIVIALLANNARMSTPYDEIYLNGSAEFQHNEVFEAGWGLAKRVEPTHEWAEALSWLYEKMVPHSFSLKDPLETAKRWHPTTAAAAAVRADYRSSIPGMLSSFEAVRHGLGRLALSQNPDLLSTLLASDDRALRAAAYAEGPLTVEQLEAGHAKDGELAFNQALLNRELWRSPNSRESLRQLARAVSDADQSGDMMSINFYRKVAKSMAAKYPQWFENEEHDLYEEDENDKPATKGDLDRITRMLIHSNTSTDMAEIRKHLNWLLMISGAALTAVILKNF